MKTLLALSLLFSLPVFADFTDDHAKLCQSHEAKQLMGKTGSCQLVVGKVNALEVSSHCEGKLADITCRVLVLKTSDSASMNLVCSDENSPLLSQVFKAEVTSYNVSAVIKTSSGAIVTLNDPNEYHVLSNPALNVQIARGENPQSKMILTVQSKAIALSNVVCD